MTGPQRAYSDDHPSAAQTEEPGQTSAAPGVIHFRGFDLIPNERLLLRDGKPVEIGCRAFDLLLVLLRSRGTVVSKSAIFDFVWPSMLVEESNLRFQVARLREALGPDADMIKTIHGRGYLLVADGSSAPHPVTDSDPIATGTDAVSRNRSPSDANAHAVVAVIDDDDATREALEGFLRSSGIAAECYSSVEAFRERTSDADVGCLVLDVCMPGLTGLEFQAEMARAGWDLPVIFISGHADVHMSVRAMKAGAVEFLTKPVRHEELLDAIRSNMARTLKNLD